MDRLRDSRDMTGARLHSTPAEVRAQWVELEARVRANGRGFPNREGALELEERLDVELVAHVNAGRWVAVCSLCGGGVAVWDQMEDACCYDCGRVMSVRFPERREAARATAVLLLRENPDVMHWHPGTETVDDLKLENLERGVRFVA